jgi:hypothetical protein
LVRGGIAVGGLAGNADVATFGGEFGPEQRFLDGGIASIQSDGLEIAGDADQDGDGVGGDFGGGFVGFGGHVSAPGGLS